MSRREGQLFVGRLSKTTRTRDLEEIFEPYGRLVRCDVKYGVEVAYAFVDFEDYRDAEDCIKYENGRNVCGSSIIVEWAKGSPRRPLQSYDECYRCHRSGHWARDCPDDRWGGGGSFRSRSFRSPPRRRRSYSRSRSRERRRRSRSRSRDRRRRSRSRDRRSRSRSKSHERRSSRRKSHDRKDSKSRDRDRKSGSKSRSRSRSKSKAHSRSKSRSRSPEKQNGDNGDGGDTGQQDEGGASPARSRSGSAN